MKTSAYQLAKLEILSIVHLAKDAIHIHIGMAVFILWLVVFRRPMNSFKSLVPVFLVVMSMEALDLHDDLTAFGYFRWSASFHDIINSVFWPVLLVFLSKMYLLRSK